MPFLEKSECVKYVGEVLMMQHMQLIIQNCMCWGRLFVFCVAFLDSGVFHTLFCPEH